MLLYALIYVLWALKAKVSPKLTAGHVFTGFSLRKPVKNEKAVELKTPVHLSCDNRHCSQQIGEIKDEDELSFDLKLSLFQ